MATAHRVPLADYPAAFVLLADSLPATPWLYTGGLENHPGLVDQIAERHRLLGNGGASLRSVRDPIQLARVIAQAGLPCPRAELNPAAVPCDGSWLIKPLRSAGGADVRIWDGTFLSAQPCYFQERITGPSLSALFLAREDGCELAGITAQILGRPGAPFAYVGSLGPWTVSPREERNVEELGRLIAASFGLRGLFGIDFILRDGFPWLVEVNPRYTAAVEVLELGTGRTYLDAHWAACDPNGCPSRVVREGAEYPGAVVSPSEGGRCVDVTYNANRIRAMRPTNSPPWEGGVGGVGNQRPHAGDPVALQTLGAGEQMAAESSTSDGHSPPPQPPLPKGGSYEVPPISRVQSNSMPRVAPRDPPIAPRLVGKLVLFADRPCRFPELSACDEANWTLDPFAMPEIADVPWPGTTFEPGEPVLTVFATGNSEASCREELQRKAQLWKARLTSL